MSSPIEASARPFKEPPDKTPYNPLALSYSKLSRYDTCPMQYRYRYIDGFRLKFQRADGAFGTAVHAALAAHFREQADPVERFDAEWGRYRNQPVTYARSESWLRLRDAGRALLQTFMAKDRSRIGTVYAVEKRFEIAMAGLPRPIIGIVDLIADVDGRRTVIDWKTSGQHYGPWSADLSDQLTTYWLADPGAEQVAYSVFLKTKEPEIQWIVSRRTPRDVTAYLDKVAYVIEDLAAERFFMRPGRHCGWCDYRPLCLGDTRRAAETLVQITPDAHGSESEEEDA